MNPELNEGEVDTPRSGLDFEIKYPNEPTENFNGNQLVWTKERFEDLVKHGRTWYEQNGSLKIDWNSIRRMDDVYMDTNIKDEEIFAIFRTRRLIQNSYTEQEMKDRWQSLVPKWINDPVSSRIKELFPAQFLARRPVEHICAINLGPVREKGSVDDFTGPWYRHLATKQILDALCRVSQGKVILSLQDGDYTPLEDIFLHQAMQTNFQIAGGSFREPDALSTINSKTLVIAFAHDQPIRQIIHQLTATKENTPWGIICVPKDVTVGKDEHLYENSRDFFDLYDSYNICKDPEHPLGICTFYAWPKSDNPAHLMDLDQASPMVVD